MPDERSMKRNKKEKRGGRDNSIQPRLDETRENKEKVRYLRACFRNQRKLSMPISRTYITRDQETGSKEITFLENSRAYGKRSASIICDSL